ncbi:hypothetical protein SCOCK_160171 [Actinacidiphila cocklensis]|uniref:Uncharacterized protein n=1 Tax=Actinacidiphila cocklensis TaxID=887465 RepID=A0A9W4DLV8_9ACTN|nr:hypothetical protein SCOCK_160171 [Actinacidiphila cocklensis]
MVLFPPVATTLGPAFVDAYRVVRPHLPGLAAGTAVSADARTTLDGRTGRACLANFSNSWSNSIS